jgi:hypothetical protein
MKKISFWLLLSVTLSYSLGLEFASLNLETEISTELKAKIAGDTLLPDFKGDNLLKTLELSQPDLWNLKGLPNFDKLATGLDVKVVYVEGIKEEAYCKILPARLDSLGYPKVWRLEMGIDFISGGSSVVGDHIRFCLDAAREKLGVTIVQQDSVVWLPNESLKEDLDTAKITDFVKPKDKLKLLKLQREIESTRKCPKDRKSYLDLLEIHEQTKLEFIDRDALSLLNMKTNGSKQIFSCAYSTEWNKIFSENFELKCDVNHLGCVSERSDNEGFMDWTMADDAKYYSFVQNKLLGFIPLGNKSIHRGGTVLDVRWFPITKSLFLEVYVKPDREVVALGLLMLKEPKKAIVREVPEGSSLKRGRAWKPEVWDGEE